MIKPKMSLWLLLVSGLISITACAHNPELDMPEDMSAWSIGVVAPSFYPVMIQEAYGVNDKYDWSSPAHKFSHIWMRSKLDNAKKLMPTYDGFGIPLHSVTTSRPNQIIPITTLPDSIYIYWASLAESKFYATKFDLSPELKQHMMTRQRAIFKGKDNGPCYQTQVIFGLLPGGDAKVWLSGCGIKYTYIDRIKAVKVSDSYQGINADFYSSFEPDVAKRAADNGVTLFPVPWDKVDRVFEYKPQVDRYDPYRNRN